MTDTLWFRHAPPKKETNMSPFEDVKTAVKLLQDRIFVSLISGLIALVGRGFAASKKVTGT